MATARLGTPRRLGALVAGAATSISIGASANCARPSGYDITVADNTVTVCATNFQNRACPDPDGLLRENTASGKVVKVPERCSAASKGCYVDECVPKGSYRYGFAKPYDCCTACCGTDYFELADVATDPPSSCTPSDGGAATPFTGSLPWGTDQTICNYQAGSAGAGGIRGAGDAAAGAAGSGGSGAAGAAGSAGRVSSGTGGTTVSSGGNAGPAGTAGADASTDAGPTSTQKAGDDGGCGCVVGGPGASRTVFAVDGMVAALGLLLLGRKRRRSA